MRTHDMLARSKRSSTQMAARMEQFQDLFRDEDWTTKNSCFKVATMEMLTEAQWKTLLERIRELVRQMEK